jgi:hypothetical protein
MNIKIIGDELWCDGLKVGTLHKTGIPSMDAAVRLHLITLMGAHSVPRWKP